MIIGDVMDQVGDQLDTITGLRVFRYPPGSVTPPAAVVSYPDNLEYDATYGRGMDRLTLPVVLVVGKASDRATRDAITQYAAGAGAKSIKAVLEVGVYTAFDTLRVKDAEFDVISIGGTDYMAAVFTIDISGSGS